MIPCIYVCGAPMRTNELHASARQFQRSEGKGAVRAAAYRSASRLYDERTGIWHDYTKKKGVEHTRVYVPEDAPDWARDRGTLWNAAEAKENRKNSMTAREWIIAFPHEFNAMQRREAGDSVARELMRRLHTAVDICYHLPDKDGDQRNFHAHVMYGTRGFDENTKDGWDKNKYRDYSKDEAMRVEGKKITRAQIEINSMREFIAGEMNRISKRDGLHVKTEHLSFEERGIDKEPTRKLGPAASDMERKGQKTDRGDINRDIREANDNRAKLKALREEAKVIELEIEREKRRIARAQAEAAKRAAQAQAQARKPEPLYRTIDRDREEHRQRLAEIENARAHYNLGKHRAKLEEANRALAGKQGFWSWILGHKRAAEEHARAMRLNYEDAQRKQQQDIETINRKYHAPQPGTPRRDAKPEGARLTKEFERTRAPERATKAKPKPAQRQDKANYDNPLPELGKMRTAAEIQDAVKKQGWQEPEKDIFSGLRPELQEGAREAYRQAKEEAEIKRNEEQQESIGQKRGLRLGRD